MINCTLQKKTLIYPDRFMATRDSKANIGQINIFYEHTDFTGNLTFQKPLAIYGNFSGEIEGESTLEIGPKAVVQANIIAKNLIIFGKVIGNIVTSEKTELKSGASLVGNIKTNKLEIERGVLFDGQCEMPKKNAKKPS